LLHRKRNIRIIILAVLLIAICRFLFFSFSLNRLKTTIEEEIEWATGMETIIEGDIRARFLPSFALTAIQPSLVDKELIAIRAQKLEMVIPLISMFSGKVEINAIRIIQPDVVLHFDAIDTSIPENNYSIISDTSEEVESMKWKVDLVDIRVLDGSFSYFNQNTMDTIYCHGVDLTSDSIILSGDADTLRFTDVIAYGKLMIDSANMNMLHIEDIQLNVEIGNGILDVSHESISEKGHRQHGNFFMDLSGNTPSYNIKQDIDGFHIEDFLEKVEIEPFMIGQMDFSVDLYFAGHIASDIWQSSKGEVLLNGNKMLLYGMDLDRVARQYERSQKFSLIDVGALFLAGPVGIAVTKGSEYANLLISNKGDSTIVHEFVSKWSLEAGELIVEDVAFSTDENRIALQGSLSLWQEYFTSIDFALINDYGCAVFHQNIRGPFTDPEISDVKVVKTLLGPVKNIFRGKKCKNPFYTGSVKPYQISGS